MQNTALILIDVQEGLDYSVHGKRNNPQAEMNMQRLLTAWRSWKRPVIHIRHDSTEPDSPLRPESPGNTIKPAVYPIEGEVLFSKNVNSAFIGTPLEAHLHALEINALVMVGLTTDHCVSTSVRMAANLGFNVVLVSDATATHERCGLDGQLIPAEQVHATHLASLHGEFCTVKSTDSLLK